MNEVNIFSRYHKAERLQRKFAFCKNPLPYDMKWGVKVKTSEGLRFYCCSSVRFPTVMEYFQNISDKRWFSTEMPAQGAV